MNKKLKVTLSVVFGGVALAAGLFTIWALIHHTAPFMIGLGIGLLLIAFIKGAWDAITSWEKK